MQPLSYSESARPPARNSHLRAVRRFGRVASRSPAMHAVFDVLERLARSDVTVTLMGETGVGKDLLAHELHTRSVRAGGPLVVFDCGSVAASLAESELLGHELGAFTGAVAAHPGAFERANGGTLFLDEIGELSLALQPRLLRALDSKRVRRVGGKTDHPVDVRVVAATHRDLELDVASGKFREDLFFRLAVAVVKVPALRERQEDLPQLVHELLADLGRGELTVSDDALAVLREHAWPGNVRELKNAIARAALFVEPDGETLEVSHLKLLSIKDAAESVVDALPLAGQTLERLEQAAIRQTLAKARGNKVHAARTLGIAVSTLYEKLKKYSL